MTKVGQRKRWTNLDPQKIGIDISKLTLDVYAYPQAAGGNSPITSRTKKELICWLGQWQIDRHNEQVDAEIATIIAADAELARRHKIISSIAGVGTRIAGQLAATMPELGALDPKQAASMAGLAPAVRQSGQ